jgi:hypothetical protein
MSRQSRRARRWYYLFRIPVVLGGVAIPGLITVTLAAADSGEVAWLPLLSFSTLRLITFGLSLLVAVLAALEEVLHYGDRWRHYRRTAERLKAIGWQYLMLNATFRRYETHQAAFQAFTERVEEILGEDVEGYLGSVAAEGSERGRPEVVA